MGLNWINQICLWRTDVSLSHRMGLADYVDPLNFLILDEPTNYLDKQRVEEFMEIVDRENIFTQTTANYY